MVKCCVEGCVSVSRSSGSGQEVTFHRLPDHRCFPNLYAKWIRLVTGAVDDSVGVVAHGSTRVCSLHFTAEDYVVRKERNRARRTLRVDAQPTRRLPIPSQAVDVKTEVVGGRQFVTEFPGYPAPPRNNTPQIQSYRNVIMQNNNNPGGVPQFKQKRPRKKTVKKIKLEPGVLQTINTPQVNYPEATPSHNPVFLSPVSDKGIEDLNLSPCNNVRSSPFVFNITLQDPECGFNVLLVNDMKYIHCDSIPGDKEVWRCILRSCSARVATSSLHYSIIVDVKGTHFHLPTNDVPVNPADWASDAPQTPWAVEPEVTPTWSPEEEERNWSEQNGYRNEPTVHTDIRFGVKDLLAPSMSHNQIVNPPSGVWPAAYPTLSSLDALSKFCGAGGGEVLPQACQRDNLFNGTRHPVYVQGLQEAGMLEPTFFRFQGIENPPEPPHVIDRCHSVGQVEQVDCSLHSSPISEEGTIMGDEGSSGSSSERTPFYQLVDVVNVQDIIQKDPLALDESNHTSSSSGNQSTLQGRKVLCLKDDDAAFVMTLLPHMEHLSTEDKEIFRKKVMSVASQLRKKSYLSPV